VRDAECCAVACVGHSGESGLLARRWLGGSVAARPVKAGKGLWHSHGWRAPSAMGTQVGDSKQGTEEGQEIGWRASGCSLMVVVVQKGGGTLDVRVKPEL